MPDCRRVFFSWFPERSEFDSLGRQVKTTKGTMPPKRKASVQNRAPVKEKKVKEEPEPKPEPEEDSFRSTMEALKAAPKEKLKSKIDSACQLSNFSEAKIHEDYDCMLNQTNIGHNNNKFYIIQLIVQNGNYSCWTRWGRVVSILPMMAGAS